MSLSLIDASIVAAYFVLILILGVWMEKQAGKSLDAYFRGGGTIPWWVLGMSGSSTYFDISGTMWMVSVFYLLGMLGMWEHWLWAFPFAGFTMAYKAKWAYRSGVLTGMEWLVFRFGRGAQGQWARFTAVVISLLTMVFMLGYAGVGVGKFMAEFLPYDRNLMVVLVFAFTGFYVLLGGFFSVVYTDVAQTFLLTAAAVYIAFAAFFLVDPVAFRQEVGQDWFNLLPVWRLDRPPPEYPDPFGLLVVLWVAKGATSLISSAGGGADFQRFRAARNEAEASKVGFAWGVVISIRWALVMSFTVFGLSILEAGVEVVDSDAVLPMVLNRILPVGAKGLVIAGMLAAFMSTFDSTLNVAASFIANDLVKPFWKKATDRGILLVGYAATFGLVVLGILISLQTERIASIWNPINFALGSAVIAPSVLAAYWHRVNGWSFCLSALVTLPIALYIKVFTDWRELQYFPVLFSTSLLATLAASFLLPSTSRETLMEYYFKVRPFGVWGKVRRELASEGWESAPFPQDRFDIPVAILGTFFFVFLYLLMMDLVIHNWGRVGVWIGLLSGLGVALYFLWWRELRPVGEPRIETDA